MMGGAQVPVVPGSKAFISPTASRRAPSGAWRARRNNPGNSGERERRKGGLT
jgi:hypothetical protein